MTCFDSCCVVWFQAEAKFLSVQEDRRHQQQVLETIQSRLRAISAELEKTNRADLRYLDLVQNEHSIIREENDVVSSIRNLEKAERESFAVLSSALLGAGLMPVEVVVIPPSGGDVASQPHWMSAVLN